MNERGILFSAPMIRALLGGSKTQTRRVVKDLPLWEITEICHDAGGTGKWMPNGPSPSGKGMAAGHWRHCPYGQLGDRLWVREAFCMAKPLMGTGLWPVYRATCHELDEKHAKWKPSIHMPRSACRILLEIVSVRVERLQDIGEQDAFAEGVPEDGPPCPRCGSSGWVMEGGDPVECNANGCGDGAVDEYRRLWESLNGAGSWDANPWVWVVEFRRVQP
jgi:hypothetical protein